jgi:hypothetical protein
LEPGWNGGERGLNWLEMILLKPIALIPWWAGAKRREGLEISSFPGEEGLRLRPPRLVPENHCEFMSENEN